jgi:rubrerythrin
VALSTFGAIMGFSSEMVGNAVNLYKTAIEKAKDPMLKENLQVLLDGEKKNYSLMERIRREHVTEMILEPITGLYQKDYEIDLNLADSVKDSDLLKMALILEENEKRFFNDSAAKMPILEAARILRKIAERKEKNLNRLNSIDLT